ncbi:MAG TPA: 3-oxoacyl-[acyl-carrier-protein] synthase III C-terminal domain-containing protein [Mycobacteriales bacterium]|nr:3-oxoacyl-[acyl-carrier-protein] synthase III C-terminal domain-containing protein [Mycobacteriales bacterium]
MAIATEHWLTTEPDLAGAHPARLESIGVRLPARRLSTDELMASTAHDTHIDLERLTGIHERRIVADGEDSLSLAVGAARDCLNRSRHRAGDLDMVINASISKYAGGYRQRLEPPLSLLVKQAIGAVDAVSFDISNACAGMLTGVFLLNDYIRRGEIERGMVVSGEAISQLGRNAARQVRSIMSRQLASLTLGDAGAAVIVERDGTGSSGITTAAFTTLAKHSRLCLAYPSRVGPGATMYTRARTIHKVAIDNVPTLLREALDRAGLDLADIDYFIPHQTSSRAIRTGTRALQDIFRQLPGEVVDNVELFGNTSSTTHFVALHRLLQEGRMHAGDRVLLLALASGLEIGVVVFTIDDQMEKSWVS